MTSADFTAVLPEVVIAIYAMVALLYGVYTGKDRTAPILTWGTAAFLTLVAVWIGLAGQGTTAAFGGMFIDDAFSRFAKVM
ncbi:MAG: NADH-quinone oxidoreductase subunit N, partial [Pseudomonadota bacterium]